MAEVKENLTGNVRENVTGKVTEKDQTKSQAGSASAPAMPALIRRRLPA